MTPPIPEATDRLHNSYQRAGFNRRLDFGERPALVIVDFVNAYLTPGSPLYAGVEDALVAASKLLAAARAAHIPVIFTRVVFAAGENRPFFRKAGGLELFVGQTDAGAIATPLQPNAQETVIAKQYASAFHRTDLDLRLRKAGVDTVLIAGLSTSGCVRATAVDAVQHDYVPIVVREAVGDRALGPHEASLFDLDAKYADVVALTTVVSYLRAVGHDRPSGSMTTLP